MKTSQNGLNLIKKYEGLRLTAYKPVATEKYWTIGYGHYSKDVTEGMAITEAQAEEFLKQDLSIAEDAVTHIGTWTQNQFDALVSFTFNCGVANLVKLVTNRTNDVIAKKIILYNKAGGKVLNGLVKRRKEEQALFMKG